MNGSGTNQPLDETYLTNDASRRTFLKGVGLAGAAGLTSPFLATTSALASGGIILGCQAPSAWEGDGVALGQWTATVVDKSSTGQRALGCRSYRDAAFRTVDGTPGDPNDPGAHAVLGNPPVFPGEQGSIPLASIRPNPSALLNGDLDGVIKDMILDGANKATGTNPLDHGLSSPGGRGSVVTS